MVYVMMHDFCRENSIPKSNYCHKYVLIYPKSSEQGFEGATFRCCNQNNQQYKVQHQEKIDESLDDGLKGLMITIKV
jgi:hypothetical protein